MHEKHQVYIENKTITDLSNAVSLSKMGAKWPMAIMQVTLN